MTAADPFAVVEAGILCYRRAGVRRDLIEVKDALAALQALREERERLTREARRAEALTFAIEKGMVARPDLEARAVKAEAERDEAREALREIIAEFKSENCDADATQNMAQIARAALGDEA